MGNMIDKMLNHPIASIFIIMTIGASVNDIVRSAKGLDSAPMVNISANSSK